MAQPQPTKKKLGDRKKSGLVPFGKNPPLIKESGFPNCFMITSSNWIGPVLVKVDNFLFSIIGNDNKVIFSTSENGLNLIKILPENDTIAFFIDTKIECNFRLILDYNFICGVDDALTGNHMQGKFEIYVPDKNSRDQFFAIVKKMFSTVSEVKINNILENKKLFLRPVFWGGGNRE